jgi:hypothetical protein
MMQKTYAVQPARTGHAETLCGYLIYLETRFLKLQSVCRLARIIYSLRGDLTYFCSDSGQHLDHEKFQKGKIKMGRVLNVGPHVGSLPRGLSAASSAACIAISSIDNGVQRVATFVGLSGYAASRFPSTEGVRNFNRTFFLFFTLFFIFFISGSHYVAVLESTEIPILGTTESNVNLYYPPLGNQFFPAVPKYNEPPRYRPRTPLLIPFTRNNSMIRQTVLSYIAAGWPRADIVIVDNSGTVDGNVGGMLSKSNPFYLDYDMFQRRYGVGILQTPTLLNFAQLQNFMARQAIMRDWPYYYWSHMDVAVLSPEEFSPYKSFYHNILDDLDASNVDQWHIKAPELQRSQQQANTDFPNHNRREIFSGWFDRSSSGSSTIPAKRPTKKEFSKRMIWSKPTWGIKMFAFDYLTLVNVEAWRETGQWDPYIPYYNSDCDFYHRMKLAGYRVEEKSVGHIFDVADVVEDPERRFFPAIEQSLRDKWSVGPGAKEIKGGILNSTRYKWLKAELTQMVDRKALNPDGRNTWQTGGLDTRGPEVDNEGKPKRKSTEPWTYDPRGFQAAWWSTANGGRIAYIKKWGTLECDLIKANKTMDDMWLLEYISDEDKLWEARNAEENLQISKLNEKDLR